MATATLEAPVSAPVVEKALRKKNRSIDPDVRELLSILGEQGVSVYRPVDIAVYKRGMIRCVIWKSRLFEATMFLTALATMFATLSCLLWYGSDAGEAPTVWPSTRGTILLVALFLLLFGEFKVMSIYGVKTATWVPFELADYESPIPLTATRLIERLRAASPKVGFRIEELQVGTRPFDPLLIVTLGTAEFCPLAWLEPGLDAPLMHAVEIATTR